MSTALMIGTAQRADPITRGDQASRTTTAQQPLRGGRGAHSRHRASAVNPSEALRFE